MDSFYLRTLTRLLQQGQLRTDMRILILCGEVLDRDMLQAAGFTSAVISNVDTGHEHSELAPYSWSHQDAENLSFEDNEFDVVIVHLGLHHCRQPHKALCEMYRVAKQGVLMVEPCENVLVRAGRKLGVGQAYEVHAVSAHQLKAGGANNSAIPNWVHRWSAWEVEQTIRAYAPSHEPHLTVFYDLVIHWRDLRAKKNKMPFWVAAASWPFLRLLICVYPRLANNIAVFIHKPGRLHPWLREDPSGSIHPDEEWFRTSIQEPSKAP